MRVLAVLLLGLVPLVSVRAESTPEQRGKIRFTPVGEQKEIPARYRLAERTCDYELTLKGDLPGLDVNVYQLRFPSPVESPHPANNTVYAEYYLPKGKGPFPAAIVLDILGGTETLSRTIATHLAQNGIAGLYVQMAYYGQRRPPGVKVRMISPDLPQTMAAIRQTVLDLRLATAWLEARPELDRHRLAILGTSLGSLIATLTAEMEPRLQRVVVLLGGGGLVEAFWDHPLAQPYRGIFELLGGTKEKVTQVLAPIDPLTCAANLKNRKLLIMAGKRDEILPPKMAEALWQASGRQKLVWFDCTHYSAILHLPEALAEVVEHLKAP